MPEPDRELADFAKGIQDMAAQGGFDPFALLGAGHKPFHSAFLAPLSPSLKSAIERFLADGGGPLASSVDALVAQGLPRDTAATRARALFAAAQGLCVIVQAGEGGLATLPQLFHGQINAEWRAQVVSGSATQLGATEELARALASLEEQLAARRTWPRLVAGPGLSGSADAEIGAYWLELAHGLEETLDGGIMPGGEARLGDLGYWIGAAARVLGAGEDGDDSAALARCHAVAGEWREAAELLARALEQGLDEEAFVERLAGWAEGAARAGAGAACAAWLDDHRLALDGRLGGSYDVARALFRLQASAQAPAEALVAAADLMLARDRMSCRHDLTREPIWGVRLADPGPLLDTVQAAEAIGKSPTFVSKKLEQGTIPHCRQDEQLRIPARGLAAWKAVMERYSLLDS